MGGRKRRVWGSRSRFVAGAISMRAVHFLFGRGGSIVLGENYPHGL